MPTEGAEVRALRVILVAIMSVAGIFAFASPASATTYGITNSAGDTAYWNASTNVLTSCDGSSGNGTAMAILQVINGRSWEIFDDNGAQPGCHSSGSLSVDETKNANLYICTNSACTLWAELTNIPT
jgi:hypothetical protein